MHIITRIAATAIAAVGALTIAASGASAKRNPYSYEYTFYSDNTYTLAVGGYRQYCYNNDTVVTGASYGEQTIYVAAVPIGECPGLGDW